MQPDNEQTPDGNWAFRNEGEATAEPPQNNGPGQPVQTMEPVSWTASEFIAHHKNAGWYMILCGGFLILSVVIYLLTRDIISIVAIGIVAVLFMVVSFNKPQQRSYEVDEEGISIDKKFYPYSIFKSFAMRQEGAIGSITFMPLKRLMPELSIYYAPEDEARILDVLAGCLPNDQRKEPLVDHLLKYLRF